MSHLRLGSTAPDFEADTTEGWMKFHDWAGDSWVMLFSHPGDFTPVCTTELADVSQRSVVSWPTVQRGAIIVDLSAHASPVQRRLPQFVKRGVKIVAISADTLKTHFDWIEDIIEIGNKKGPTCVEYPIIADEDRKVSMLYDMLDAQDPTNVDEMGLPYTIRTVFVIDPKKIIRAMIQYPAAVGRDFDEVIRVIDALQAADKYKISTPHISDAEAKEMFKKFEKVLVITSSLPKFLLSR
ncbi:hypothetical protein EUX98_g5721 [Antrodiella citrinella]|uniref:Thioredoxin domain-containing protein n=1 Tax=Antrodiella citrinella TaxID=2447956 RepID=A0A4V3XIA8_9APHY|nr:hypothetical protein EUX98_g5721 [Antrodiella citrinella]